MQVGVYRERLGHVVTHETKAARPAQRVEIQLRTGDQIVDGDHFGGALRDEPFAQVRAEKTRTAEHGDAHSFVRSHAPSCSAASLQEIPCNTDRRLGGPYRGRVARRILRKEVSRVGRTTRAAVLAAPREVRIETLPLSDPAGGQVRVRLEGCGVCHSNLPVWEGREWFRYPLPPGNPGHEGWGRVDAVGSGVSGLEEGQRVAFLSSTAYAEYDVVPQ